MSDDEHVLSVWIGEAPAGQAAVQLVAMGDDGHRVVERLQGECAKMRELVDELTEAFGSTDAAIALVTHDRQLRSDLASWHRIELR